MAVTVWVSPSQMQTFPFLLPQQTVLRRRDRTPGGWLWSTWVRPYGLLHRRDSVCLVVLPPEQCLFRKLKGSVTWEPGLGVRSLLGPLLKPLPDIRLTASEADPSFPRPPEDFLPLTPPGSPGPSFPIPTQFWVWRGLGWGPPGDCAREEGGERLAAEDMVLSRKQGPGETVSGPACAPVLDLLGRFLSTEVFLPQPQGGLDRGRELSCLLPGSFAPAHPGGLF